MGVLDSLGETLGGLTDSVMSGGEQWLDSWFDNEATKVASAAPEENRTPQHQEPAREPTGQPIYTGTDTNKTLLIMGGGFMVLMMFMILMMRGK